MDVQRLSGPPVTSASTALRPLVKHAAESGANVAERDQSRFTRIENALSQGFPAEVKLQLDIDRNTGTVIGRVVDRQTGEVIRQIPSEEMIALMARSAEINALLDKTV